MLDREQSAGPAKTGLDLVRNEQDPVAIGDLAEARQEAHRWHHVATLSEHGLDDECGDTCRVHELGEESVELPLPVARALIGIVGTIRRPIARGVGSVIDRSREWLEIPTDRCPRAR